MLEHLTETESEHAGENAVEAYEEFFTLWIDERKKESDIVNTASRQYAEYIHSLVDIEQVSTMELFFLEIKSLEVWFRAKMQHCVYHVSASSKQAGDFKNLSLILLQEIWTSSGLRAWIHRNIVADYPYQSEVEFDEQGKFIERDPSADL